MSRLFRWLRVGVALAFAGLFLLFALNNRAPVTVSLFPLPWEADMPLFLLAALVFASGVLIGGVMVWPKTLRLWHLLRRSQKRAEKLHKDLEAAATAQPTLPR